MELQFRILNDFTVDQAKALQKANDSVCARRVAHLDGRALKKLRLRLGTDPANDAATLASVLWGRKRQATSFYLFVHHEDLTALDDPGYVAKLCKAFSHCTRRSLAQTCTLFLVSKPALALAS